MTSPFPRATASLAAALSPSLPSPLAPPRRRPGRGGATAACSRALSSALIVWGAGACADAPTAASSAAPGASRSASSVTASALSVDGPRQIAIPTALGGASFASKGLRVNDGGDMLVSASGHTADGRSRLENWVWYRGTWSTMQFGWAPRTMNNSGLIGGGAYAYHPTSFLWQAGTSWSTAQFFGPPAPGQTPRTEVTAVNDLGVAAGTFELYAQFVAAVIWRGGVAAIQPTLGGTNPVRGTNAVPHSINRAGRAVGRDGGRAVAWENDQVIDLGWGAGSAALDINTAGQIVGSAVVEGAQRAVRWQGGVLTPLATLAGMTASQARAINDEGQIVGSATINGARRAMLWDGATATDLGGADAQAHSEAADINSDGHVVGTSMLTFDAVYATFRGGVATEWKVTRVVTPTEQIIALTGDVAALPLLEGLKTGLTAKLADAAAAIAAGDTAAACTALQDFINHANALAKAGKLTTGDAAGLVDAATKTRAALGC